MTAWRVGYRRMGRRLLLAGLGWALLTAAVVALVVVRRLSLGGAGALIGIGVFGLLLLGRRIIQAEKVATRVTIGEDGIDEEATPGDRRHIAFEDILSCRTGADPSPPNTPYLRIAARGHDEEVYVTGDAEGYSAFVAALKAAVPDTFE